MNGEAWALVVGFGSALAVAFVAILQPNWFVSAVEKGCNWVLRRLSRGRISAAEAASSALAATPWLTDRWASDWWFASDHHVFPHSPRWPGWPSVSGSPALLEEPASSSAELRFPW